MTKEQKIVLPFLVLLFATPIVLLVVQRSRAGGVGKPVGSSRGRIVYETAEGFQPVALNEETWEWQDWKGRNRSLKVHRKVSNR